MVKYFTESNNAITQFQTGVKRALGGVGGSGVVSVRSLFCTQRKDVPLNKDRLKINSNRSNIDLSLSRNIDYYVMIGVQNSRT